MSRYPRLIWENDSGLTAEFSVYDPDFFCNVQRDVKGLSDVSAKINTISNVGQDGETETSVYLDPRQISIKGSLRTHNYTEQNELVRRLNRIMDPHEAGTLYYVLGDVQRKITCRASKAPTWSKTGKYPTFSIELFCPNPYWVGTEEASFKLSGGSSSFFFPLPERDKWPLTTGLIIDAPITVITNSSDADTGLIWQITAKGTVVNPKLTNVDTGEFIELDLTLEDGDVLTVTTGYGKKRVRLVHDGVDESAYRSLVLGSTFFPIYRKTNNLKLSAKSETTNMECFVGFENRYLGVGL
ncbi:MAG: phage tail family protein [Clostridia bacterium]|nr:phage tail family protein [Clostridia bacterium]